MAKKNKGKGHNKIEAASINETSQLPRVLSISSVIALIIAISCAAYILKGNDGADDPEQRRNSLPATMCDCASEFVSSLCHSINSSETIPYDEIYHPLGPPKNGTNVAVLIMYSDEIKSYTTNTATMNAAYAQKNSYDFMVVRTQLFKQDEYQFSHAVTALPQSKMKYIRDALVTLPEGGWLLWLDADLVLLRHDVTIESILAEHIRDSQTDLLVSLEFNEALPTDEDDDDDPSLFQQPRGVNTGALLLRHSPWTLGMLERWHLVGYQHLWGLDELTPWGEGFLEHTKKRPPDQQMHNELQRPPPAGLGDEYRAHAVLLPTTTLNHRWPAWALDGFDGKKKEKNSPAAAESPGAAAAAGGGGGGLQFAFHFFASTAEERDRVFAALHRTMLCPRPAERSIKKKKEEGGSAGAGPQFESRAEVAERWRQTTPVELSQVVASEMLAALGERAAGTPRNSFASGELCNAVYAWAGGTGTVWDADPSRAEQDVYHPLFTRVSEKHRECLDPGLAAEVARHMADRRNFDGAAFALQVATATASRIIHSHEAEAGGMLDQGGEDSGPDGFSAAAATAAPGTVMMEAGLRVRGDPATVESFVDHLRGLLGPWQDQLKEVERLRAAAGTFLSKHTPPGHETAAIKLPTPRRRSSRRNR